MKKLQLLFMALAFTVGIAGVFSFAPKHDDVCSGVILYYTPDGTNFFVADPGTGSCSGPAGQCLYYNAGTPTDPIYTPCPNDPGQKWVPILSK